jgi:hypothetical protein
MVATNHLRFWQAKKRWIILSLGKSLFILLFSPYFARLGYRKWSNNTLGQGL